VMRVLQNDG